MSEVLVSPEQIVKYFAGDAMDKFLAYQEFQNGNGKKLNVSPETIHRWNKGAKPPVVKTIEFLEERGILPLAIDNPNMPLLAYIIGLTWHSGCLSTRGNGDNPTPVPDIHISQIQKPKVNLSVNDDGRLESIADNLSLRCKTTQNKNGKAKRYALSAEIGYLFAELGVPYGEGHKIDSNMSYPDIIEKLRVAKDQDSMILFTASHLRTKNIFERGFKKNGAYIVRTPSKRTQDSAEQVANAYKALYELAMPEIRFISIKHYSALGSTGLPRHEYQFRINLQDVRTLFEKSDQTLVKCLK